MVPYSFGWPFPPPHKPVVFPFTPDPPPSQELFSPQASNDGVLHFFPHLDTILSLSSCVLLGYQAISVFLIPTTPPCFNGFLFFLGKGMRAVPHLPGVASPSAAFPFLFHRLRLYGAPFLFPPPPLEFVRQPHPSATSLRIC